MIQASHAQMLAILAARPTGLKTAEIITIADENPQSLIADNNAASKMIYSMRNTGLVTSWIDAGKNRHKITTKGINELKEFNDAKTQSVQSANKTPPDESLIVAEIESEDPRQTAENTPAPINFDPFGEIYAELQKAQQLLENLPRPKPTPTINKPSEKILMLTLVKNHYELINSDVGELFADMINDYQRLEQFA